MLAVGASAANGLANCQVDVTFTSLTISYDGDAALPVTLMRVVRPRGMDYARLQGITELARAIGADRLDIEDAHRRLDRVVSAPTPTVAPIHALGWAGVAGAIGVLLGGGWLVALVAALTTSAIEQIMRAL